MDPMFGAGGWCHSCGILQGPQTGSLTLQRRNLTPVGVWVSYWNYDGLCVDAGMADSLWDRLPLIYVPCGLARQIHRVVTEY